MLKKRVITASILLPIALTAILYGSTTVVDSISAVVLFAAALEWNKLIGIQQPWLSLLIIGLMISIYIVGKLIGFTVLGWCLIATTWWLISCIFVVIYPKGQNLLTKRWVGFCLELVLFIPTWLALDWLHAIKDLGPIWLTFVCFLVWGADVGAYCTGKLWGKKKLIEKVSAGKTWIGVFGAFFFAGVIVLLFAYFWLTEQRFIMLVILSIMTVIFSILGDLVESIFKRNHGVKDSGNLLPGHGGVLDRIDSLLAAVPTFMVGLSFFQSCKG